MAFVGAKEMVVMARTTNAGVGSGLNQFCDPPRFKNKVTLVVGLLECVSGSGTNED